MYQLKRKKAAALASGGFGAPVAVLLSDFYRSDPGRYDVKSPNCNIYKTLYPEALRLEGLRLIEYGEQPLPMLAEV